MIPEHLSFQRLKRLVKIEHVLADKGRLDSLRKRGAYLVGPCPIHRGDNPNAFVVHPGKNLWHCFTGCDAGGDVVELVRRLDEKTYQQAAVYLATLAGSLPTQPRLATAAPPRRPFRPFTRRIPLDPTDPFLIRKGIRPPIAERFEVGAFHGRGMLDGCLAVRLFDPCGRPLGYAGRQLDPLKAQTHGKWKFPPALPRSKLLYGYHQAKPLWHRGVVLTECPWGVLRLAQIRIPAVALLGTHLSAAQYHLLEPLPRLVVVMDGDKAGRKAARAISQRLPRTIVVKLPDGRDPDDMKDMELAKTRRFLL